MVWRPEDPQGNEAAKIRHMIVPYTRGTGLDLGCGPWKAWPHMIGVDNFDEWGGIEWRPDVTADCTDLSMFADDSLDFVFSSHLLEHLEDTEAVLREWWRMIKPGGYLTLYLPHKDLYPNIGEEGGNPDHKHDFLPQDIEEIIEKIGYAEMIEVQTRDKGQEYSFFQVYCKRSSLIYLDYKATKVALYRNPRNKGGLKSCIVTRYGGIGDMIMAASILPKLRQEGYHITMNTTPLGREVLGHDPHIDDWWIQDKDQVPNDQLGPYWAALAKEFDRAINLSETIEGPLLTIPGRRSHAMSQAARRKICGDINYVEFLHDCADVPFEPRPYFFPTGEEELEARAYREKLSPTGEVPIVVWALTGSSVHKTYPWVDQIVHWLLDQTEAKIVFVGGKDAQLLEFAIAQGLAFNLLGMSHEESNDLRLSGVLLKLKEHFGQNRILCRSGSWTIRQSLAFARLGDVVVGPETGVLNAVAMVSTPKVLFMSHSSLANLPRDWANTMALYPEPEACPCHPCHRLHYDRTFCPEHEETGAALCAATIRPEQVFKSIQFWIEHRRKWDEQKAS